MAGSTSRTVNVNIKYNVDTVEVVKAQAASRNAQKATDDLRKATEDYGKASAKAAKEASGSLKQVQADTNGLASQFNSLYSTVKTVFTAGILAEVVSLQLGMAKLSGQVEGVSKAFSRLPASTVLLNDLRESTHGTVTDLELMQKALMAQNFRIPLQNLGKLMEFAAVKAQQTGQEVNHLVDYIVSGIGYRSIKRLDDLGFTANRVKEALGGVSLQAASMQQVMAAVTKLMDEDLQKTGGYAETAATDVDKLSVAIQKLNVEVSEKATNRGVIQFFTNVIDLTRQSIKAGFDYVDVLMLITAPTVFVQRRIEMAKQVAIEEEISRLAAKQVSDFQKQNDTLKEREKILNTDKKLYELAQTLKFYDQQEVKDKTRLENLSKEIAALKEKNESFIGAQKQLTEESKLIQEKEKEVTVINNGTKALQNNKKIVKEAIQLLVDYRSAVTLATDDKPQGKPEDNTRGFLQALPTKITVKKDAAEDFLKDTQKLIDNLTLHGTFLQNKINLPIHPYVPNDFQDKLELALKERKEDIINAGFTALSDQLKSIEGAEAQSYQVRINQVQAYYDDQIKLAGNNEKLKQDLQVRSERETNKMRAELAQKEWKARRNSVIIDTAAGIMRAFATMETPKAIVEAGIIAALGLSNLAIIGQNKPSGFAKGVLNLRGPGTETSDSIPAYLSKGESVMTAAETKRSMGLLEAIKHNKIDDRILRKIDFSGGNRAIVLNDEKIVKAIQSQKFPSTPDIVRQAGTVYEVYTDRNGNRKKIRSKSI